jgi:hypothetical protein
MPESRICRTVAACITAWVTWNATAATSPPAAPAEAAAYQTDFEAVINDWSRSVVNPPSKSALDADMAARLKVLGDELRPLLQAAGRRWLGEVRAAAPDATGGEIELRLMARLNDELVSWLVSSPGAAREAIEWSLAQQPAYCRQRLSLHETQWALLADRLLFLQPLKGPEREVAIAAERQRWQAWLNGALQEPSTPTPPPQLQAFQAAERQRGDEPVGRHAMSPWLSRFMLGERPPKPYGGLMEECALMQWWLANEVERASLAPQQAMRLFRFGTLPVSEDLLFLPRDVRQRARNAADGDYPPIGQRFEVTGATRATVLLDSAGRVLEVQITERQLTRPGLAPGRAPVAFEQTFDRATFARLRAARFERPAAADVIKGVARKQVELKWTLQ